MAMKKGLKVTLIILAIVLVLAIAAAAAVGYYYKKKYDSGENFDVLSYRVRNFDYENDDKMTAGNISFKGAIDQVYIDWAYGEVIIEGYDGEELKFEEDEKGLKDEEKLQWYREGTVLNLNYRKSGRAVYEGDNYGKTLHVYVPNASSKSLLLDVWTVSGDITCKDFDITDIDTITKSGKTTCKNLNMSSCSFVSDSGDMDFDFYCKTVEAETQSGNVVLTLPDDKDKGFSVIYDSATGKFTSEFKFDPEIKTGGGVYISENAVYKIVNTNGDTAVKKAPKTQAEG